MSEIVVVAYDPLWPAIFERLRAGVWPALQDVALAIEHVGSTSVVGLAAKPVIDMNVVVADAMGVRIAIEQLATLGYRHRGNLGIEGREAFFAPNNQPPHHLYVCPQGSLGLRNHLAVRDAFRRDSTLAERYGRLKQDLARLHTNDLDAYVAGKSAILREVLAQAGLEAEELGRIETSNLQQALDANGGRR